MFKRKPDAIRDTRTLVQEYREENEKSGYTLYKPYRLLPWYELYVWVDFTAPANYPVVYSGRQFRVTSFWGSKKTAYRKLTETYLFDDLRAAIIREWFV